MRLRSILSTVAAITFLAACSPPLAFAQTPCVKTGTGAFTIRAASGDTVCILKSGAVSYRVTVTAASPAPTPTPAPTPAPDPVPQPSSGSADIAFTDFSNGYGAAFNTPTEWAGDLTVIADPTGAGRGKVLQAKYAGGGSIIDINRAIYLKPAVPSHFFFTGDLYFPSSTTNLTNSGVQRKLLYFRTTSGPYAAVVVKTWGNALAVEWLNNVDDVQKWGIATLPPNTWNHLEVEIQANSAPTVSDGVLRIWVNGTLALEQTKWRAYTSGSFHYDEVGIGYQREGVAGESSVSEVRYWSRIAFSTKRLQ